MAENGNGQAAPLTLDTATAARVRKIVETAREDRHPGVRPAAWERLAQMAAKHRTTVEALTAAAHATLSDTSRKRHRIAPDPTLPPVKPRVRVKAQGVPAK